mgnify:CR=1 FL=1
MGKQHQDEIEVVVDLEDLIEWEEEVKSEPNLVLPPPPPVERGEFEGWEVGEEDLT